MKRVLAMFLGAAIFAGCQIEQTTEDAISALEETIDPVCDAKLPGVKEWDPNEELPPSDENSHVLVLDLGDQAYLALFTSTDEKASAQSSFASTTSDAKGDDDATVVRARKVSPNQLASFLHRLALTHAFDFKRPPIRPPYPGGQDFLARLAATYQPLALGSLQKANQAVKACSQ